MSAMSKNATPVRLADLTAPAAKAAAMDKAVILLPLGSQEDHGPHLPMGDFLLAEMLAEQIALAAGAGGTRALVAPCLPFGVADYFGSSPGGLAISAAAFRAVLQDMIAALLRHGFTKIILLNGHGGNVPVIQEVTLQLRLDKNLVVPSIYLWKIARQLMEQEIGADQSGRFGHGAEPLLSLTMALRGQAAEPDESTSVTPGPFMGLPVSGFGTVRFDGVDIDVPTEFDQVPRAATAAAWPSAGAELGKHVAGRLVKIAADFVLHFDRVASISGLSSARSFEVDAPARQPKA
jgi:creatinine amidohydrolase